MDDAEIIADAVGIDAEAERERLLDEACGADPARRARLGDRVRRHLERGVPEILARPLIDLLPEFAAAIAGARARADDDDFDSDDAPDPLVGTTLDGIRIVRRIGVGTFGRVYEGWQERPRRTVAVKVMRPAMATRELVRRFEMEAELLAQLDHPAIARIHAAGTVDLRGRSVPYFVMDFVAEARPLTHHAAATGLTIRARLELFRTVCAAVAEAHRRGVIHRDLKPANILVGAGGAPRVIDFGWGRSLQVPQHAPSLQTIAGQLIGTCEYMSPEQFDGDPQAVDTRSDVYSLGVILHELLAGNRPYDLRGKSLYEAAAIVHDVVAPPLHRIDHRIARDVATIAATCLAKERHDRYSSAHELAADLGRHLAGDPIAASPPRASDAIRRFARRHTLAAASLATAFISLAVAVTATSIFALRSEHDRKAKEQALTLAESRLAIADRETANARRQLYVANLYRLASLAEGSNVAAATECFVETLRGIDIDPGRARGTGIPGLPIEMRCLWPLIDHTLVPSGGILTGKPLGVCWSADGGFLAAGCDKGAAALVALTAPENVRPLGTTGVPVRAVAFAPDGARIATATAEGVHVWDTASGHLIATGDGPAAAWDRVAFRPDGRHVAAAAADGTLALWDATGGSRIATPARHTHGVTALAYSPDGSRLLSASHDVTVRIWDADNGARLHRLFTADIKPFLAAAFSPDGTRVAAGDAGGGIRIWDVDTGDTVGGVDDSTAAILAIAWSPDGRWLAAGDDDGIATVREAAQLGGGNGTGGDPVTMKGHGRLLSSLAWSPDSRLLATASHDRTRTITLWEAATGRAVRVFKGHADAVTSLAYGPDGTRLASTGADRTLRLWDVSSEQPATVLTAAAPVVTAAIAPDGARIACGTAGGEVIAYDARSLERIHTIAAHSGAVTALTFLADGRGLLSGGADGRVRIHEADGGGLRADLPAHEGAVRDVRYLADGRCVSAGADGVARVCDGATGKALASADLGQESPRKRADQSPGGEAAVTALAVSAGGEAGTDGVLTLAFRGRGVAGFALATGARCTSVADETARVGRLAASNDGRFVATGSLRGGLVTIVDAATGRCLASCPGHKGSVTELRFSADGTRLYSAGEDNHVRVWSVPDGTPQDDWDGLEEAVLTLAESPAGDRLATGSTDGAVRLWDVADGSLLAVLRGHTARVRSVAFAPDGTWLLSVSEDGTARVWGRSEADVFAARSGR
ncbi:MAG: WD40 repeat domain-containing serine/threonine protein kinase [Pirellulales bacterium]